MGQSQGSGGGVMGRRRRHGEAAAASWGSGSAVEEVAEATESWRSGGGVMGKRRHEKAAAASCGCDLDAYGMRLGCVHTNFLYCNAISHR